MTHDARSAPAFIGVKTALGHASTAHHELGPTEGYVASTPMGEMVSLLRDMLVAQTRQNELLEELNHQIGAAQRQRATELSQWRKANPGLARDCRAAAEMLGQVQTQFLKNMTCDINDNMDNLVDGEFVLNEFVDRYGPRLAHLNGVLQVLSQLSSIPSPANAAQ